MDLHEAARQGNDELVNKLLGIGCPINEFDHNGMTPLAHASQSAKASTEALKLLIDSGADPNLAVSDGSNYSIGLAATAGSIAKVQMLLDAGADIRYSAKGGYSIVVHCIYGLYDSEQLCEMISFLYANGADLNAESDYRESPLSVASLFGRFDAVKCLLDLGAKEHALGWNELMKCMAWGTDSEFQNILNQTVDLAYCDRYKRSAWHLAALGSNIEKAKMLLNREIDIESRALGGKTALILCAERGNDGMLAWLIDNRAQVDATDNTGATALIAAARASKRNCFELLLSAGANPSHKDSDGGNAMSVTCDTRILKLLEDAGEDIADLSTESKRQLLGFTNQDTIECTVDDYRSGCKPRFGDSNPEMMDVPFWKAMIRFGGNTYRAQIQFDPNEEMGHPIWCFDRFGMSFTKLTDGRFVQIAGEHEDYYDPDFCIYNDVIVHNTSGRFKIYGYPKELFPPTDFHTATLVDDFIYIIGNLGYAKARRHGETPVYRLNTKTWAMEAVQTVGDNPGWIYKHKCRLEDGYRLVVNGGTICTLSNGKESHDANTSEYELDLRSLIWARIS
ncbi:MAG: ankyrin repeat domain-containing protein [Pirellula sp.]